MMWNARTPESPPVAQEDNYRNNARQYLDRAWDQELKTFLLTKALKVGGEKLKYYWVIGVGFQIFS